MTLLDDAIAAHAAHAAGSLGDPLTESLLDQQAYATDPVPLREGWENEPVTMPHNWPLYVLAVGLGMLISVFVGYGPVL